RLAGINVQLTRTLLYIIVSCFAILCGIFMASRFNSAQPAAGVGTELTILASIIIGGTSIQGGSGSILGTFFGCILLSVIKNGLILMRVSSYWIDLIFGAILIISLFIDKYRRSKTGGGF
ncbi:ABC transporter permease, partial [bacterium]|nr:ABC transporter permease [candidate division CSSED10-310 bacterium]